MEELKIAILSIAVISGTIAIVLAIIATVSSKTTDLDDTINSGEYDTLIDEMLVEKKKDMISFLKQHMSPSELNRYGHELPSFMADNGDIAKIKLKLMIKNNK